MHVNRMFGRVRRGISMLEVGAGLAVAAVGFAGFALMQNDATQATRADASGAMMRTVVEAAVHYVQSRRSELLSSTTAGGEPIVVRVARRSATEPVPENSLQSAGFLPDNWIDRNAYGHHHALLIRQAENQELRMLVVQQGGRPVPRQADLVRAAARIGPGSGFVPAENVPGAPTTHATGLGGIWSLPRSEWTVTQDGVQFQPSLARNAAYVVFPNTPAGGGSGGGEGGGSGGGSGWNSGPSMGQTILEICITTSQTLQEHQIPGSTRNIEYILIGGGGGGGGISANSSVPAQNGGNGTPTILMASGRTVTANGGFGGVGGGQTPTSSQQGLGQGFGFAPQSSYSQNPGLRGSTLQFPQPITCSEAMGAGDGGNGWQHNNYSVTGGGGWNRFVSGAVLYYDGYYSYYYGVGGTSGGNGRGVIDWWNQTRGSSGGGNGGSGGGHPSSVPNINESGGGGSGYINAGQMPYSGGPITITIGQGGAGGAGVHGWWGDGGRNGGNGNRGAALLRFKN